VLVDLVIAGQSDLDKLVTAIEELPERVVRSSLYCAVLVMLADQGPLDLADAPLVA
jgi:hypothetical protein